MKSIRILYRVEDSSWWAESPELPGWTAAGDSFEEVRAQALEGAKAFSDEPVMISEVLPVRAASSSAWNESQKGEWNGSARLEFCVVGSPLSPHYPTSLHVPVNPSESLLGRIHGALEIVSRGQP